MSTETNTPAATAVEPKEQGAAFTPPATQADLDRIIQDRVARVKNQYADYDDLKTRVTELDGKIKSYESAKERAALVSDVAKGKNVPAEALRGSTREELEAHADTLAKFVRPSGPIITNQGRLPDNQAGLGDVQAREAVNQLFDN